MAEEKQLDSINRKHVDDSNVLTLRASYDTHNPENIVEQFLSGTLQKVNFVDFIEGDGGVVKKEFPKETIEFINRFGDLMLLDEKPNEYFVDGDGDLLWIEDLILGKAFFEEGEDWTYTDNLNSPTIEYKGSLLVTSTAGGVFYDLTFDGFVLTEGVSYEVEFTIDSEQNGLIAIELGGTAGTTRTTVGTFTETIVCGVGGIINIAGGVTGVTDFVEISNLKIKLA